MRFDDEPVPGYPLPILPGHTSPGRLERVLRGGGWTDDTDLLPVSNRFFLSPDARFAGVGFRCVRDVDPGRPGEGGRAP